MLKEQGLKHKPNLPHVYCKGRGQGHHRTPEAAILGAGTVKLIETALRAPLYSHSALSASLRNNIILSLSVRSHVNTFVSDLEGFERKSHKCGHGNVKHESDESGGLLTPASGLPNNA